MIQSKRINIISTIAMILALIVVSSMLFVGNSSNESRAGDSEPQYATRIFGKDIISIEIIADESDWQEMLENAKSEQFIIADVIINGAKFEKVGVRPKGNSSLTQVASSDSDRYSFRLQFDEYIKNQTCFGLKSFVVNNMLSDNSYMKEYISYDLMKEIGVETPYFGFADIKVNGDDWGFYLAIELYNESYEQRVFGDISGMLYNVKSMDIGDNDEKVGVQKVEEDNRAVVPLDMNGGPGGMGGRGPGGNSGGSLAYIDDDYTSYSSIFDNVVGKGDESDYQRVIEALKALSENRDIEKYFDVDQILRYLAAHTIVVNLDSYSSNMAQNYYIYEKNGELTILPWDYNMAWGGFQSGDASAVINFPIDTPVSGVEMSARPLLEKLFANTEYLESYHKYLQQLVDVYFTDGKFEMKVNELDTLINEYVKNDPSAFCSYEDYDNAVSALITLGNLRAKSVQGQLDGTVPSTTIEQNANPEKLISAEGLDLRMIGSMGDKGDRDGGEQSGGPGVFPGVDGNMPDRQIMQQAIQIIQETGGKITDEAKIQLKEFGLTEDQMERFSTMGNGFPVDKGNLERENVQNTKMGENVPSDLNPQKSIDSTKNLILVVLLASGLLTVTFLIANLKRNY